MAKIGKTLLDFCGKEPEKTVHCSQRHQDVPLSTCLEKCVTMSCRNQDQIVALQETKPA